MTPNKVFQPTVLASLRSARPAVEHRRWTSVMNRGALLLATTIAACSGVAANDRAPPSDNAKECATRGTCEAEELGVMILRAVTDRNEAFFASLRGGPSTLTSNERAKLWGETGFVFRVIDGHEISTTIAAIRLTDTARGEPTFRIYFYDQAFMKLAMPPTIEQNKLFKKRWVSITAIKTASGWRSVGLFDDEQTSNKALQGDGPRPAGSARA